MRVRVVTLMAIFFLMSCSGEAAHTRNVHTSFASWLWGTQDLYFFVCIKFN